MKWVVANWKMNLTMGECEVLASASSHLAEDLPGLSVVVAAPFLYLTGLHEKLKFRPKNLYLASQTVSSYQKGAYTGDVAAFQLKGIVSHAIIGHSERRKYHQETGTIANQIIQALEYGITPIVCFGELKRTQNIAPLLADLRADLHGLSAEQIAKCLFAYEPVWAISSHKNAEPATPNYITNVVSRVTEWFSETYHCQPPILYGGSVTEDNCVELARIKQISGALVGGASLHIKSFTTICRSFAGQA